MFKRSRILGQESSSLSAFIALLLSVALAFGGVPAFAWADDAEAGSQAVESVGPSETDEAADESIEGSDADEATDATDGLPVEEPANGAVDDPVEAVDPTLSDEGAVHELDAAEAGEASLFYVDAKEVQVGEDQVVLITFDEVVDADEFILRYENIASGRIHSVQAYDAIDDEDGTSVAFVISFDSAASIGDYRIVYVVWSGAEEGAFEAPMPEDGVSFSVIEATSCDEGITVMSLDDDGDVVETEDMAQALDATDADEVAAGVSAFANSRAIADQGGRLVVALDPGHGGSDPGASYGSTRESDLTLRIARACRDRLQQRGVTVVMTRDSDTFVGVVDRPRIARQMGATVFVSLHINSGGGTGYEVWVQNRNWKPLLGNEAHELADVVVSKLAQFNLKNRGVKERNTVHDTYPDGSKQDYYGVLRVSKELDMPAILIEHGFIDTSYDRNILNNYAGDMGYADAEAILEYYQVGGKLIHDGHGYRYQFSNGAFLTNAWKDVNGARYYFKEDGYAARYYNDIGGQTYYFWSDCTLARNTIFDHKHFDQNGVMSKAKWIDFNGRRYYAKADGQLAQYATVIGGNTYLFWSDHSQALNQIFNHMHFDQTGVMSKSKWIDFNGRRYYAKADGQLAQYATEIGGKTYLFWSDHSMAANLWWGNHYYGSDGAMATDTWVGDIWVDGNGNIVPDANNAIMGISKASVQQMVNLYNKTVGSSAYPYRGNSEVPTIQKFCEILARQAESEGVRADVVFAQSMLETNWLRFTGVCKPEQYNFAGIGATGGDNPGNSFRNISEGLLAQVQHLKAYASTAPLNNTCVDPRFHLVTRGCAPVIAWLGIQENPNHVGWASGAGYGDKITRIMNQL